MRDAAFPPSIELTRLYEKTSARGTRYFVGRLGLARITLLPGDAAEDGTATWRMLLQEAPKPRASADRPGSNSSRPRSPGTRRRQVADPVAGAPMPDDSVAELWPGATP
jgi:hypothetical protein